MAVPDWIAAWFRFGEKVRCKRCGLAIEIEKHGPRRRLKVDPDKWMSRCKSVSEATAPFACPHLKAAALIAEPGPRKPRADHVGGAA